jgi:hypothetical protein
MGESFFRRYMRPEGLPQGDAAPAAPPPDPEPPVEPSPRLDFRYVPAADAIPPELEATAEWRSKFLVWFTHLRLHIEAICGGEVSPPGMMRSIETGEFPKLSNVGQFKSMLSSLDYFKRDAPIGKCELAWLFTCFLFVDRLVSAEIAERLAAIASKLACQIVEHGPDSELFPHLSVCVVVIRNFFHVE